MGDGRSIVIIPALVYLVGMNIHFAIGTGLVIVGSTALMGVIEYSREKIVEWCVTLVFVIFGILNVTIQFSSVLWILIGTAIGITVGRIIAMHTNNKLLRKAFAFFVFSIVAYIFLRTIGFISVV